MQKALLMASVFIGAFLFSTPVQAQEQTNPCPLGGTLMNNMCVIPAPSSCSVNTVSYQTGIGYTTVNSVDEAIELLDESHEIAVTRQCNSTGGNWSTPDNIIDDVSGFDATCPTDGSNLKIGNWTRTRTTTRTTCTVTGSWNTGYIATKETGVNPTTTTETREYRINFSPDGGSQCPPSGQSQFNLGPVQHSGANYCYYLAAIPDNDDDCPPGTFGDDCTPLDDGEDCFIGGNGMKVCPKDPNDVCESDEFGNLNCPPACGFVNNQFFCTDEPDSDGEIPDLSHCFKVGNSYVCPDDPTPPDDSITDPDKPITDLNKGDLKESNKGVETRLDATNKLLAESNALLKNQTDADAENTEKINKGQGQTNAFLKQIDLNTKKMADGLTSDGNGDQGDGNFRTMISNALGITGDETIDDLTDPNPISLDQFKSEFQWSGGGGNCPAPRSINVMGKSFSMDWSPFCQAFNVLSYFVLAAAYFFSTIIAFGGKK